MPVYDTAAGKVQMWPTCVSCAWYRGLQAAVECGAPGNFREKPDFVNGGMKNVPIFLRAENCREAQTAGCGSEGRWWEAIEETAA